jgi:hypothetical protein
MERNETAKLIALIMANYSEGLLPSGWTSNSQNAVNTWHALLNDLPFDAVKASVLKHMMTNEYPPTVAHIRGEIANMITSIETADEAWGMVQKAIRQFGYVNKAGALAMLPDTARIIVERFGWDYYCQMPVDDASTYYAQFRQAYQGQSMKRKELAQVPDYIRAQIMDTPALPEKRGEHE